MRTLAELEWRFHYFELFSGPRNVRSTVYVCRTKWSAVYTDGWFSKYTISNPLANLVKLIGEDEFIILNNAPTLDWIQCVCRY